MATIDADCLKQVKAVLEQYKATLMHAVEMSNITFQAAQAMFQSTPRLCSPDCVACAMSAIPAYTKPNGAYQYQVSFSPTAARVNATLDSSIENSDKIASIVHTQFATSISKDSKARKTILDMFADVTTLCLKQLIDAINSCEKFVKSNSARSADDIMTSCKYVAVTEGRFACWLDTLLLFISQTTENTTLDTQVSQWIVKYTLASKIISKMKGTEPSAELYGVYTTTDFMLPRLQYVTALLTKLYSTVNEIRHHTLS